MKSNYNYKKQLEVRSMIAERTNLVTSPPKKQADEIAMIKDSVDSMDCVEVTITFKPTLINSADMALKSVIEKLLNGHFERGTAILYHEYGNGRLHYHGIFSSMSRKTLSGIRKFFSEHIGRIEIKSITYFESYLRYMTKEVMELDYDKALNIWIFK